MKQILLIMMLVLGTSVMAQIHKFEIKTITTNEDNWEDVGGRVVVDDARIDFYYSGHHLTVHTDPDTFKKTTDKYGNDVAMWTCSIIDNNDFIGGDMLFTAITNENRLVFMLMSKVKGDPFYLAFTLVPEKKGYSI